MHIDIINALIERPLNITIGGRSFSINPPTLGKSLITGQVLQELDLDPRVLATDTAHALLRIVKGHKEKVLRLIALFLCNTRKELLNDAHVADLVAWLTKNADDSNLATLFFAYLAQPQAEQYFKSLGIEKERMKMQKVNRVKDNRNSISIGGVSIYGSLLDVASERYGWTLDYTLWGISLLNLQLMLADSVQSVYLSDKERKKVHISDSRSTVKAEDKGAVEAFFAQNGNGR